MRPVNKGAAPATYATYQDAGPDLRNRLGDYCSYCERRIETNLAVEHIQPKSIVSTLQTDWNNFLLACVNCNSNKGDTAIHLVDYFWPDVDNTLLAFEYVRGGRIVPHASLLSPMIAKAVATLQLTGLDRNPCNAGRTPSGADQRWLSRHNTWQLAKQSHSRLAKQNTTAMREQIVETAIACGMFCIWWTVFDGDIDIRRRLREAFTGTHAASFDVSENPTPRVGGQL